MSTFVPVLCTMFHGDCKPVISLHHRKGKVPVWTVVTCACQLENAVQTASHVLNKIPVQMPSYTASGITVAGASGATQADPQSNQDTQQASDPAATQNAQAAPVIILSVSDVLPDLVQSPYSPYRSKHSS